jgi:hypothetical protein
MLFNGFGVDVKAQREKLLACDAVKEHISATISKADGLIGKTYPAFKMSEYMLFPKTGNRRIYEDKYFERRGDCSCLALAYWLTEDEKYVDSLIDIVYTICDEFSWCLPAHAFLPKPDPTVKDIIEETELFQAETGRLLAEVDILVGDVLPEYVRDRISYEIRRRIINPLVEGKKYGWQNTGNNWAGVCAGNSFIAVSRFASREEIDSLIPMYNRAIENYLGGFRDDGCCVEGYGYWNFGFGGFLFYAEGVYNYTSGRINWFDNEKIKQIAMFGQRIRLGTTKCASFSDNGDNYFFSAGSTCLLRKKYGREILYPAFQLSNATQTVPSAKDLIWFDVDYKEDDVCGCTYAFKDAQWYIYHGNTYSIAAKAGSNWESHNHNDVGSYMIVTRENEVPLAELGSAEYTKDYFDENVRYTLVNCGSHGHSVPFINDDVFQQYGPPFVSKNVEFGDNYFSMDIEDAYEHGRVEKIRRRFEFGATGITVKDKFVFTKSDDKATERIVSRNKPEISDGVIDLGSAKVYFDKDRYSASYSTDSYRSHSRGDQQNITAYLIDIVGKNEHETEFEYNVII